MIYNIKLLNQIYPDKSQQKNFFFFFFGWPVYKSYLIISLQWAPTDNIMQEPQMDKAGHHNKQLDTTTISSASSFQSLVLDKIRIYFVSLIQIDLSIVYYASNTL